MGISSTWAIRTDWIAAHRQYMSPRAAGNRAESGPVR
jgi:hypothetical protein